MFGIFYISDWICKNMARNLTHIIPSDRVLTFIVTFNLFNLYRIFTEYAAVDRLTSFTLAINLPETERLDIASFVVGSNKSLASHVGYGGEIGEMELKFDLISDQREFYGVI